jgi:hypothetical protein
MLRQKAEADGSPHLERHCTCSDRRASRSRLGSERSSGHSRQSWTSGPSDRRWHDPWGISSPASLLGRLRTKTARSCQMTRRCCRLARGGTPVCIDRWPATETGAGPTDSRRTATSGTSPPTGAAAPSSAPAAATKSDLGRSGQDEPHWSPFTERGHYYCADTTFSWPSAHYARHANDPEVPSLTCITPRALGSASRPPVQC